MPNPTAPASVSRLRMLAAGLVLLAACGTAALAQPAGPRGAAQAPRQPLDPLSAAEQQAAGRLAAADPRVRELAGGGRVRLVYVELANVKAEADDAPGDAPRGRHAEVVQYRYDDDSGIRALVDLGRGQVRAVERIDGGSVPLTQADLDEAVALALGSAEVRELLGSEAKRYVAAAPGATKNPPYAIRALLVHASADGEPCFRQRCVHLFFNRMGAYLTDTAIVDLTGRGVRIERAKR